MKKIYLKTLLTFVLSLLSIGLWAQSEPQMNVEYTIPTSSFGFSGWNNYNLPKSAFLSDATSAIVKIKNTSYAKFIYGKAAWATENVTLLECQSNPEYEVKGEYLTAALNGYLWFNCDGSSNIIVTVLNKNENYVEPTPEVDPDEGGDNSSSTPTLGFAEVGVGTIFNQGENVYTLTGNAETMIEGAVVTIISDGTDINCHLKENLYKTWIRGQKTITLTAEQVQDLAKNDYVIYVLAWNCTVSNITLSTLNNNTDEEEEEDPTPYDKDRTNAFGYEFTNAQLKKYPQLTDVPTVYLNVYAPDSYDTGTYANNDIKTGTPQTLAAKYQLAANSKITEKKYNWYYQTQIIVRDDNGKMKERNELTTVRARGNSTWRSSDKKPLRLKFPSKTRFLATSADDKTSTNAKSWTLLANDFDKSMLRNGLTHELVDYINKVDNANNLPFNPACQYVDLVVNGEYWGTYQISDQVQVGPGRVDVDADNGWFVEYTINNNGFVEEPFLKIGSSYVNIKNPEDPNVIDGDPNSTAHIDDNKATTNPIYDDLKTMLNNLHTGIGNIVDHSGNYASSDWMKYIDTRSLVDWFIAMDITGNWDGDIANDYLYKDVTDKKLKVGPLWDLDLGFGNYQGAKKHFYEQGGGIKYSIEAMLKDPYFVKKLYERWQQIYNDGALTTYLNNKVAALSGTLAQTQAENYKKWYLYSNGLGGKTYSTYQAAVDDVVAFNNVQIPWLETEYKSLYDSMGCADLEDIVDEPEEETGGEEGGEDTSGIPETSTFTQNNVEDTGYLIPANAFNPNATKIQVTLTRSNGTATRAWGFYGFNGSEYVNNINGSDWTTYTINVTEATDIDAVSKNGLKWRLQCESGTVGDVTIVVKNILNNTPGTDTPEPPSEETFEQLTDLPTMYLQIYKLNEDGTSDKTQTETITTSGGAYHTARIVIVDENGTIKERDEETEIRGRGNSTWSGDNLKNPYRLKFPTKTKLLSYLDEDGVTVINNYANAKSWTLLANKGDYSLIRNALTAELGKYMDMPFVPAYKFVDLVINGSYAGTYQISDQVQVAKDRVNVNSDTGWFLSANRGGGYEEDPYFTAGGATFNIKNPEADTPTASGVTTDTKYDAMKAWMTEAMNNASKSEIANYFDMESLANYLIGIDITGDPDGAVDNFYMYREDDSSSKMKFGPMWDYDLAYGNVTSRDRKKMHFFEGNGEYGWMSKLMQIYNTPELIKPLWKRWKEVYGEYDSEAQQSTLTKYLLAKVDELDDIIAQSQAKNFAENKAGSVAGSNTYSTHAAAIAALKAWIPAHIEWLNSAYKADYKTITGLDPDNCTHTYTKNEYASNGDGTYSRKCDICGMAEEGGTKFYKYTTYENGTATETFNESKTWATDNAPSNPNAIIVVENGSGITGKNIVVNNKGTYTCANLELTDGYSFYSPIKFTATTATYTRNVSNDWGTICLPYKVQTVEADDATYYQLKNVGKDNSTLVFEVAKSSGAYTPLVFKRKSGSSITVTATDVTVKATSEDKTNSTVADWTLIGTVEKKYFADVTSELASNEQLYYIAQNKFWQATTTYTNNPFRAYFIYTPSTPSAAKVSMFSISTDDNLATDITSVNATRPLAIFTNTGSVSIVAPRDMKVSIYSANGMLVETIDALKDTEYSVNLAAGIYMINGLKFVVK